MKTLAGDSAVSQRSSGRKSVEFKSCPSRDGGVGEIAAITAALRRRQTSCTASYDVPGVRETCTKAEVRPLIKTERWTLTTLRETLVKIGAKVVRHGRYVTFQLAEVAVPRSLFEKILSLIDDLRRRPVPA